MEVLHNGSTSHHPFFTALSRGLRKKNGLDKGVHEIFCRLKKGVENKNKRVLIYKLWKFTFEVKNHFIQICCPYHRKKFTFFSKYEKSWNILKYFDQ